MYKGLVNTLLGKKMDDTFKIFVHRLRDGHQEKIEEILSPEFLDIHEKDLAFNAPVTIEGNATLANDVLVLILAIEAEATMPCAVCNRPCQVKISISNFCHTVNLDCIKSHIFDYKEILREGILLELPYKTECNGGDCPERIGLAKYFNKGQ
jgi:uncharacterized metal-binding protein YceD (DUF177 family)